MNNSTFTLGQIPTETPTPVPQAPKGIIGPMYLMAEKLFMLGHTMLNECKNSTHTDYPGMDEYHKDCDVKWKRAIELINMSEKMLKN